VSFQEKSVVAVTGALQIVLYRRGG